MQQNVYNFADVRTTVTRAQVCSMYNTVTYRKRESCKVVSGCGVGPIYDHGPLDLWNVVGGPRKNNHVYLKIQPFSS